MKWNIFCELTTGNILMCMTGIGNTSEDYQKLLEALQQIAAEQTGNAGSTENAENAGRKLCRASDDSIPWNKKRPLHAAAGEKKTEDIRRCSGRICGASLIPYPPGIPLVCPGEVLDDEDIRYVLQLRERGEKVIGIDEEDRITVISEHR